MEKLFHGQHLQRASEQELPGGRPQRRTPGQMSQELSRGCRLEMDYRLPLAGLQWLSLKPQQTGVLFSRTVHVQPALHMVEMQSQQDWIISQQCLSPEVQVMQQPQSVISTLQMPMVRLQVQTVTPFIVQQTEQRPPINAVQRFCIMLLAVGSSQTQVMRTPLATFSKR